MELIELILLISQLLAKLKKIDRISAAVGVDGFRRLQAEYEEWLTLPMMEYHQRYQEFVESASPEEVRTVYHLDRVMTDYYNIVSERIG